MSAWAQVHRYIKSDLSSLLILFIWGTSWTKTERKAEIYKFY